MPAKNYCDPEKERYWRSVVQRFESSGLSGMQYCKLEGIKYTHFSDWRQRIKHRDRAGLAVTERTDTEWTKIIEAARGHARGIRAYLDDQGIDCKAYYKRFIRLRKYHPEWKSLAGRKGKPKPERYCGKTTKSVGSEEVFAPIQLIERSKNKEAGQAGSVVVEVVLPNALILKVGSECPLEFLSALVSALGSR